MTITSFPIWIVDVVGSVCMILLSFLCLNVVFKLRKSDPNNVIWIYLIWVCFGLTGFAISRSGGHIVKQFLVLFGHDRIWYAIQPASGAINTFMFVVVSAVTLFFERIWKIYSQMIKDQKALQTAHEELLFLNQNLERLVQERTAAVALSEHKYRRIFEISRDMILVAGKDGAILELNPAGSHMLGLDGHNPVHGSIRMSSLFSDGRDWKTVQDGIEGQGFILNAEIDIRRLDGSTRRALLSGSLEKGVSPDEDTIHLLVKDIEDRKLMESQIAQADKLASIGQLSAGIAHEINNPLGIILGYTQLLLREAQLSPQHSSDLKTIEKNVKNCKTIVEGLLNFARSSKPEREPVDINAAIDDVLDFFRQHAEMGGTRIVKEFDSRVPKMMADEKKIKQVLINLLMNAKHAVGNTGTIRLATRYDARRGCVSIKVSDTGYGIEKKDLSRIFDPFFTTKPTGEGTGLGLSVSYGIVKNHGGDIFVESTPGKGSTFTVCLPVDGRVG